MTIEDIKTVEDLARLAVEKADDILEAVERDLEVFSAAASQPSDDVESVAGDVETASDGVISAKDYIDTRPDPGRSTSTMSHFERVFRNTRHRVLVDAARDVNGVVALSLAKTISVLDEIEALAQELAAEAGKIAASQAAGLLIPPARSAVSEIVDAAADVVDVVATATGDVSSQSARRAAADRVLGQDILLPPASYIDGVEPGTSPEEIDLPADADARLAMFDASGRGTALATSTAQGLIDPRTVELTRALSDKTLENVSHIAICLAIAGMDRSLVVESRARLLYERLKSLATGISGLFANGFVFSLQKAFQEAATDAITDAAGVIDDKIKSLRQWLSLEGVKLPTFVSLVESIGDRPTSTPIIDDATSFCDLNLTSFCDGQGLLEAAASLDAEIADIVPRPLVLGKINLIVEAPVAEDDYRPAPTSPDSETDMFLVSTSASQVLARMPYRLSGARRTRVPESVSGQVSTKMSIGDVVVDVASDPGQGSAAARGVITFAPGPGQTELEYESRDGDRFYLKSPAVIDADVGTVTRTTGEYRDSFINSFERSPVVSGGPGSLEIAASGEVRETVDYTSSDFDAASGQYTFHVTASLASDHKFTVLCRPEESKTVLFKGPDLRTPAARFDIDSQGLKIAHASDPSFDFSSEINVADYDGGKYVLYPGRGDVGLEIDSSASSPTSGFLVLKTPFPGRERTGLLLSRGNSHSDPGANVLTVKLNGEQKRDLLADQLAQGQSSSAVSGRVVADGGSGSRRITAVTADISTSGSSTIMVVDRPVVMGDESGMAIEVVGRASVISGRITDSSRWLTRVSCDIDPVSGLVSVASSAPKKITGDQDSRFLTTFAAGDGVYVHGGVNATVVQVNGDADMDVDVNLPAVSGASVYVMPPAGLKSVNVSWTRTPREVLEFSSIKNVDDEFYDFGLVSAAEYSHGPQSADIKTTVRILPSSTTDYLARYTDPAAASTPRFDDKTVPPGSLVIRAVLEKPEFGQISGPLVLASTSLWAGDGDRELALASVSESQGLYIFYLSSELRSTITAGDVVYVLGPEIADLVESVFPEATWHGPFEDFFAALARDLESMAKLLCLMLQGRPVSLIAAATGLAAASAALALAILPIRAGLSLALAGVSNSQILQAAVVTFIESGMDKAAGALVNGDITELAAMTQAQATSEGQAGDAVEGLGRRLVGTVYNKTAADISSLLTTQEMDKIILSETKLSYADRAKSHLEAKREAALEIRNRAEDLAENAVGVQID